MPRVKPCARCHHPKSRHRYPDIAYHCAAKQLRRNQKETSA